LAYNVSAVTGVEFAVTGWPTTRPVPAKPTFHYCPATALVLGDPWTGAISGFGELVEAPFGCGVVPFAWFFWNTALYTGAVTLDYAASVYSYPTDPHNYVLGAAPDYVEDVVVSQHGCMIKGTYAETVPYADCNGVTAVEPTTWSNVKAMYK